MAGREDVSLSPHAVTAPEVPPSGFRLALIAQDNLFITSWVVHPGGAPDSLVHGLCTRNAVCSVVKVPEKGKVVLLINTDKKSKKRALQMKPYQKYFANRFNPRR